MGEQTEDDPLFATTWVHVFEEDGPEGAVYRPEDDDIPLSRRPRERLQLKRDGSACLLRGGADDRFVEQPATWREEENAIVIHTRDATLRIIEHSPSSLLVKRE